MKAIITILCVAMPLGGCSIQPVSQGEKTAPITNGGMQGVLVANNLGSVLKTCDQGRAIYVFNGYRAGGIAVVDNALECGR